MLLPYYHQEINDDLFVMFQLTFNNGEMVSENNKFNVIKNMNLISIYTKQKLMQVINFDSTVKIILLTTLT